MTSARVVGCVIPTHDRADLLREALASVLSQDLPAGVAIDVVVVDDTESSATTAIVEELDAATVARVRLVHRTEGPGGASASRNAGAALVDGDVLAFLDDDDIWESDHLRRLLDALDAAGTDMAVSWMDEFHPSGEILPTRRMTLGLTARDAVVENVGLRGSNLLLTRASFEGIGGFDPALPVSNDKDLLVRFLAAGRTYTVLPSVTVRYRIHGGFQLTKNTSIRAAGIERYIEKHASLLAPRDVSTLRRTINVIRFRTASDPVSRARALAAVAVHSVRSRVGRRRPAEHRPRDA